MFNLWKERVEEPKIYTFDVPCRECGEVSEIQLYLALCPGDNDWTCSKCVEVLEVINKKKRKDWIKKRDKLLKNV